MQEGSEKSLGCANTQKPETSLPWGTTGFVPEHEPHVSGGGLEMLYPASVTAASTAFWEKGDTGSMAGGKEPRLPGWTPWQ